MFVENDSIFSINFHQIFLVLDLIRYNFVTDLCEFYKQLVHYLIFIFCKYFDLGTNHQLLITCNDLKKCLE